MKKSSLASQQLAAQQQTNSTMHRISVNAANPEGLADCRGTECFASTALS